LSYDTATLSGSKKEKQANIVPSLSAARPPLGHAVPCRLRSKNCATFLIKVMPPEKPSLPLIPVWLGRFLPFLSSACDVSIKAICKLFGYGLLHLKAVGKGRGKSELSKHRFPKHSRSLENLSVGFGLFYPPRWGS